MEAIQFREDCLAVGANGDIGKSRIERDGFISAADGGLRCAYPPYAATTAGCRDTRNTSSDAIKHAAPLAMNADR